ncbi:putative cytochrome P450 12c1, mitochondrial [Oratosquilla oratoria]|uniref:putative cytochrome P450 12c1, mitochondrial n=1 Tax=Oratosquilla oratoria TaxID=337810 RepID=UPI003F762C2F
MLTGNVTQGNILPASRIPGPPRLPFLGSLISVARHKDFDTSKIHKFWASLVREYGPIIRVDLPRTPPLVYCTSLDDVETIMRTTLANPQRGVFSSLKKVRDEAEGIFSDGKTGLLTEIEDLRDSEGTVPDTFITELYKWTLENNTSETGVDFVLKSSERDKKVSSGGERSTVFTGCYVLSFADLDMREELVRLLCFERMPTAVSEVLELESWKCVCVAGASSCDETELAEESINKAEARLEKSKTKEKSYEPSTFMESLFNTKGLTRSDVMTLLTDILMAGVDTTAHTMAFTLYCLARNPNAQEKARQDVEDAVVEEENWKKLLTPQHIAKFTYPKVVLKESLRLYPLTLGVLRILDSDAIIGGFHIPKGENQNGYELMDDEDIIASVTQAKESKQTKNSRFFAPSHSRAADAPATPVNPASSQPGISGTVDAPVSPANPQPGTMDTADEPARPVCPVSPHRGTMDTADAPASPFSVGSLNHLICHDDNVFPRSNEFLPERWLRHQPYGPINAFASLPFAHGTRMCIGRRLAELQVYALMARILHSYKIEYNHEDIEQISRLVFAPSKPLRFTFIRRQQINE